MHVPEASIRARGKGPRSGGFVFVVSGKLGFQSTMNPKKRSSGIKSRVEFSREIKKSRGIPVGLVNGKGCRH